MREADAWILVAVLGSHAGIAPSGLRSGAIVNAMNRILLGFFGLLMLLPALASEPTPPVPAVRVIYLVRHGHYAPDPAADPKLGPGLTPLGVAQAKLVGARLAGLGVHFDALYVSPLQRARDTAAVIGQDFPGRRFAVRSDLAECTPPMRLAAIMAREKTADMAACAAQLDRLFAKYFKPAADHEDHLLMVAHGNVIRALLMRALGVDKAAWLGLSVGHASLTKIRIEADGSVRVIAVGDVGHLPVTTLTGASGDPDRSLAIPALR